MGEPTRKPVSHFWPMGPSSSKAAGSRQEDLAKGAQLQLRGRLAMRSFERRIVPRSGLECLAPRQGSEGQKVPKFWREGRKEGRRLFQALTLWFSGTALLGCSKIGGQK